MTQPADAAVFHLLKNKWKEKVHIWREDNSSQKLLVNLKPLLRPSKNNNEWFQNERFLPNPSGL